MRIRCDEKNNAMHIRCSEEKYFESDEIKEGFLKEKDLRKKP